MRLNRNSLLFIALLAIVIIVALIFLQDNDDDGSTPDIDASTETIQIFPEVSAENVVSLTISELREAGDIRPTPIPGNPTLVPPTPLPEGVEPEITNIIVALNKDAETSAWTAGEETTLAVDGTVDSARLAQVMADLTGLRSNRQFTPSDGNYASYGLDNPVFDISFLANPVVEGDALNYRLRIGDRTVGENSYYAFLNEDSETVYIVNGASTLQNSILNLTTSIPLEPVPTATPVPFLNSQFPFAGFILTNATGFTFSNSETGDVIEINRNADNTAWVFMVNGDELEIQQETLQIFLNSFTGISGVDETSVANLATLGLDTPAYRFEARMVGGTVYTLQVGNQDPAETIYYSLVDDFEQVVLIDADSLGFLLGLLDNPLIVAPAEVTPEATADVEATAEVTPEATADVEATAEVTPEATVEVEATAESD